MKEESARPFQKVAEEVKRMLIKEILLKSCMSTVKTQTETGG